MPRSTRRRQPLAEYRRKRDFSRTREPMGAARRKKAGRALRFVIHKHQASHLHFDLRLELDGVMKSWAVPKGPSYDPRARRLAVEVEDHPIEYNTFEGTIPEGEYGAGTVMLWDRGTYGPEQGGGADAVREGYERGMLKITFRGKRMRGGWVLVRTRGAGRRNQWLLIKHRDDFASEDYDVVEEAKTSVKSRRTMEQITAAPRRSWHSTRRAARTKARR